MIFQQDIPLKADQSIKRFIKGFKDKAKKSAYCKSRKS